jgi:hypothetical protein
VENQVSRFWRFFTEKKYEQLRDCYSAEAQIFGTVTDRAESALAASSRRNIEYFADHMKIQANLGTITVHSVGERVAIASYTFSFSAVEIYPSGTAHNYEIFSKGRATQVFVLDRDNTVRIAHEHF